jgi:large subunit ribosomal protein L4
MKSFTLPVYNQNGEHVQKIELDPNVFNGKVNQDVLYQAVLLYRANCRKGLATTKTRGEVSGGGRKPWRQKGTGRARVGSIRNPLWRKGGVVFGPHPRDYSFRLPKKIRIAALKSSLNAKLNENGLLVINVLRIDAPKTKEASRILFNLKLNNIKTILLMLDKIDTNLRLSFQNIGFLDVVPAGNVNAYDVLKARRLIVTLAGLEILIDRIKKNCKSN